ncbi:hypothetical protein [Chengkuizengella axinellae]|uniref:ABM domain-containing protein n=1 Tax=Chengkuizengella axinellae TaxID=3064388 RepID=A0ABT9IXV1_9BACL|nr:hypothetical protein [Chengkuizengella sp. 2205SS18-9]MDP5274194.1 hypothetical protein [Chengkuizengella sp. 2205SS18-9]
MMFVKVYQYHIQADKEKEYLEIQKTAAKIYEKYLDSKFMYIKSNSNPAKWIEIAWYKDEESYNHGMELVNEDSEIKYLFQSFKKLLDPNHPEIEEGDYSLILSKNLF